MRLHYIQHVPFETPGLILDWANKNNHSLSSTMLYKNEKLPNITDFDMLVIMGGPMNIYDFDKHPWLKNERDFIKNAIYSDKKIVGICLGAQLIASVLGADIYQNDNKEIGWFKVNHNNKQTAVLHWHGDTFDLPDGANLIFTNNTCVNQGFIYNKSVLALQFHLEMSYSQVEAIIDNCIDELDEDGIFIQSAADILAGRINIDAAEDLLYDLLDELTQ